ncbi:MAG TPA: hypothetical protein VKG83_01840 [Mycobacterium sp.]|nr:hypothetical protein [Mycobacterium sp.]
MADENGLDTASMPKTEAYTPIFDTGAHQRAEPAYIEPEPKARRRRWWHRRSDESATEIADEPVSSPAPAVQAAPDDAPPSGAMHAPAPPIVVPGRYHHVKWWQFILTLLAVWVPAAAIGSALFYWWTHDNSAHKTPVVFAVLAYVVVCTVAALMLAMVPDRPLVSALAIAMMSAVLASVIAAAPFYGAFYCDHSQRHCLMGVIPH